MLAILTNSLTSIDVIPFSRLAYEERVCHPIAFAISYWFIPFAIRSARRRFKFSFILFPLFVYFLEHLKNIISVTICQQLFQKDIQILLYCAYFVHKNKPTTQSSRRLI
nr:MAG TPA: hypothetical protein [Caudoviricetes sp.]